MTHNTALEIGKTEGEGGGGVHLRNTNDTQRVLVPYLRKVKK